MTPTLTGCNIRTSYIYVNVGNSTSNVERGEGVPYSGCVRKYLNLNNPEVIKTKRKFVGVRRTWDEP